MSSVLPLGQPSAGRLLLVDSYDSFSYNLAALCRKAIPGCSIHLIKNDELVIAQLLPVLSAFSAIVVGPGPGSPDNTSDIGIIRDLWDIADENMIPIFGVCLGLQSLGLAFGARLKRLGTVKHGQVSRVTHTSRELFAGADVVDAVRYHSLYIELTEASSDLEELAWVVDGDNGRVLMAARHLTKPFWGVQYHPESVCTNGGGLEVVANFWRMANEWSQLHSRVVLPWDSKFTEVVGPTWPHLERNPSSNPPPSYLQSLKRVLGWSETPPISPVVATDILEIPDANILRICELFGVADNSSPFILLDSAGRQPGRFSIIASLTPSSQHFTYFTGDEFLTITRGKSSVKQNLVGTDVWTWLATFMRARKTAGGAPELPFWGGLVGYMTYELGLQTLPVALRAETTDGTKRDRHADLNFIFVERSVVVDASSGKVYLQSLLPNDKTWMAETKVKLQSLAPPSPVPEKADLFTAMISATVMFPEKDLYISRIKLAKEQLFAGESYELCLTALTCVSLPKPVPSSISSSWTCYKNLRKNNPAPHSAYMRLNPTTILSSSPERFLSYSRGPETVCQLRPIKGTVRKTPGLTREMAEELLSGSVKEVAENLMIVDLIRHDLHNTLGDNVIVKQFCQVEEYETVWQLVSVIEGQLTPGIDQEPELANEAELGWEVLRRSFPPGSMTGAPKKRSCEILQTMEDVDRGIYSGVMGYWCVSGAGDWSVTIRTCFKYEDDKAPASETDEWVLGAGGAITALSDPEAEWDEMLVKLESVLRAFGVVPEFDTKAEQ